MRGGGGRSGGVSPLLAPWGALRGRGELEGGKPSIQRVRGAEPPANGGEYLSFSD